jgi:hypothetical protein
MFVVVGVAVDDDVGAVWLAIDANTSAHTSMVVVVVVVVGIVVVVGQRFAALAVQRFAALVVVVGIVVVVGQRFAALVVQRFAALVSVHVRRPLVFNCSLGRSRPQRLASPTSIASLASWLGQCRCCRAGPARRARLPGNAPRSPSKGLEFGPGAPRIGHD